MSPTLASLFAIILLAHVAVAAVPPFFYDGYTNDDFAVEGPSDGDRADVSVDRMLHGMSKRSGYLNIYRRSCIRRGGRCDHRPDDCCSGGACRCNLWGTNCLCQRMGIFQKWG